jgi:predicted RNase H-like nuclease (RuvC/YqgF family)
LSEVYDEDLKIEWGTHWQELQQASTFAQWYSSVNNWHQASAEQLRVGVGGVQHMQQRLNHLTVLLEQTEQALASTRRQQQAAESHGKHQKASEAEAAARRIEELRELQEEQEHNLKTVLAQKIELARDMEKLRHQLDEAMEERRRDQQQMEETNEQMMQDIDNLRQELADQQVAFHLEHEELHRRLAVAREEQTALGKQRYLPEKQVQELQKELDDVREQARPSLF